MWCVAHTATLLPTCRSWSLAWVTENRLLFFRWSKRPERQKLCLFSVPSQRDRKRISTSLHAGLFDEHKHLKSLLLANAWHLRLIYKWWIFAGCPRSHPLGQHKLRVFYWKISIANMFSPSLFSSPLVSGWLVLCSDKLRVWILLLCKKKEKKKKNRKMWQVALYATFTWSVRWSTYRHLKESFFVYLYLRMQTSSHVHLQKHRSKIATHTLAHAQTRVYVDSVLFSSKLQYHSVQSLNCKNTVHCKGSLLVCERGKSKRNLSLITGTWTSKKSRV